MRAVLTLLIALAALPTDAMAQQHTIHGNDGRVVGRYTTDSRGMTTLYGPNGRVISRATGNTTIIHHREGGQVIGDRPRRERRR